MLNNLASLTDFEYIAFNRVGVIDVFDPKKFANPMEDIWRQSSLCPHILYSFGQNAQVFLP